MRKTTQLSPNTKTALKDIQTHLKLKNESQAVAYLISMYGIKYSKMTMPEHEKCMQDSLEMDNQKQFDNM